MREARKIVLVLAFHVAVVSGNGLGKLRAYSKSHFLENSMVEDEEKVLEDPSLLGRCQEGCRDDDDCDDSLKCFYYSEEGPVPPGCDAELLVGDKKYCSDPADEIALKPRKLQLTIGGGGTGGGGGGATSQNNTLRIVANDGFPNSSYPLQKCEGDCDLDDDCEGALECKFQSGLPVHAVRGCYGKGLEGDDYCHDPADPYLEETWPPEAFRLRLYWNQSYYWQETKNETWWCMECWYGCDIGDMLFLRWCDMDNTRFVFLTGSVSGRVQIQVGGTNRCLEYTATGTNENEVRVQLCDPAKSNQWFVSQLGSFDSDKFDIRPIDRTSRCFSQQHHPKELERVYTESCNVAHGDETGYWSKFPI